MVEALKKAGPDLTREKFLDAMAHINVTTDTYAAPIVCNDPVSHQCNQHVAWMKAAGDHAEMLVARRNNRAPAERSAPMMMFGYLIMTGSPQARCMPWSRLASPSSTRRRRR